MFHTESTDPVDERRRAEHGGDVVTVDGGQDFAGVNRSRPGKVHFRDHRGHAQGRGKEGEQWKGGEVDLARLDAVDIAERCHLGAEIAVAVDCALGWSCAATGEEDGRCLIPFRACHGKWGAGLLLD